MTDGYTYRVGVVDARPGTTVTVEPAGRGVHWSWQPRPPRRADRAAAARVEQAALAAVAADLAPRELAEYRAALAAAAHLNPCTWLDIAFELLAYGAPRADIRAEVATILGAAMGTPRSSVPWSLSASPPATVLGLAALEQQPIAVRWSRQAHDAIHPIRRPVWSNPTVALPRPPCRHCDAPPFTLEAGRQRA